MCHGPRCRNIGGMNYTAHPPRTAVTTRNLYKTFGEGDAQVHALSNITLGFPQGQFTAIMGPSGSGKSTLMHILATLESPDQRPDTSVAVEGIELTGLNDAELSAFRSEKIGFIFQAFNLVPTLTAAQNIDLPLGLSGKRPDAAWREELIESLGLRGRLDHRPAQLSGGQQQRVAIARALLPRPAVIFADEPTGNLDSVAGQQVLSLLATASAEHHQTIIMVTHDPVAASAADSVVLLKDGYVVGSLENPTRETVVTTMAELGA